MAYTVLARKFRSRTFDEVIGQEPIARTLKNAIAAGRIHHGYLFTGTRGVGKTSMARILAKALNCSRFDAPTPTPCCECDICKLIAEGQDVDVLEIDAASNTGVDNIRELRENATYKPARARFRVYIIDEVHMLSAGAFNALLKTLEEPPEHVKFILATTEIHKVPATIKSRCQCFTFRNIGPEPIARRLREIAQAEGAEIEDAVVQRLARLANGSMRDGLSLLDQLLSVSPTKLDAAILDEVIPPTQDEQIFRLLERVADGDPAVVLQQLDQLLSSGRGLEQFCNDAIEIVRTLMLIRTCGLDAALVDVPAGARDAYAALSARFELSHYVQIIPMLEELRRNVRFSGAGRALTEALMVRVAHLRQWAPIEKLLELVPPASGSAEKKKSLAPAADRPNTPESAAVASTARDVPVAPPEPPAPPRREPGAMPAGAEPAVARRTPIPIASSEGTATVAVAEAGPDAVSGEYDAEAYDDSPAEYELDPGMEAEADSLPSAAARNGGVVRRREVSRAERAQVERDPVVQRALALFNGILISVERHEPAPTPDEME